MYKEDLASNNLQWLICYTNQPNQTIDRKIFHNVKTDIYFYSAF